MKKTLSLLVLLFAFGCTDDPNTFFSLGEFRAIALHADIPEIDGTSVTPTAVLITPYISDITAGGRNVSLTIHACVDPGLELGNEPVCDLTSSSTQTIAYSDVNTSILGSRLTGALPSFTVNVPAGLLSQQTAQTKFNGINYLITVDFTAGTDSASVYKRIVVSERTTKNHNPKIQDILLNGNATGNLEDKDVLTIDVASSFGPETFDYLDLDGQQTQKKEKYTISWFSYKGTTDLSRAYLDEKTKFKINKDATNPFVVAILRDDRGGIDFQLHE